MQKTKTNGPSRIALEVHSQFTASHTLEGFEVEHFHLWKVSCQFEASLPLENDRLIDLVYLQKVMDGILQPLHGRILNTALTESPTTENLATYVWEKLTATLPDAPLSQIHVQICDLEGVPSGSVRVFR